MCRGDFLFLFMYYNGKVLVFSFYPEFTARSWVKNRMLLFNLYDYIVEAIEKRKLNIIKWYLL